MLLSIITINYNNLVGLRRTVASVLAQSYKDFEYIVIDGASTDGSYEFLAQHSGIDQWISEPDKGVFQAMNKGIQHAHGEYCLFLNSGDTLFAPDSLEGVVGYLGESDFYTGAVTYLDKMNTYTLMPPRRLTFDFLLAHFLPHPATFNRTEWIRKHPYHEHYNIASDWELYVRACLDGCSYTPLPNSMVSIFVCDGISSRNTQQGNAERRNMLDDIIRNTTDVRRKRELERKVKRYYSRMRTDSARERQRLIGKIERAMQLPPLARDWKILRNAAKALVRDLFAYRSSSYKKHESSLR